MFVFLIFHSRYYSISKPDLSSTSHIRSLIDLGATIKNIGQLIFIDNFKWASGVLILSIVNSLEVLQRSENTLLL